MALIAVLPQSVALARFGRSMKRAADGPAGAITSTSLWEDIAEFIRIGECQRGTYKTHDCWALEGSWCCGAVPAVATTFPPPHGGRCRTARRTACPQATPLEAVHSAALTQLVCPCTLPAALTVYARDQSNYQKAVDALGWLQPDGQLLLLLDLQGMQQVCQNKSIARKLFDKLAGAREAAAAAETQQAGSQGAPMVALTFESLFADVKQWLRWVPVPC